MVPTKLWNTPTTLRLNILLQTVQWTWDATIVSSVHWPGPNSHNNFIFKLKVHQNIPVYKDHCINLDLTETTLYRFPTFSKCKFLPQI